VLSVSRGKAEPYLPHPAWDKVERIALQRDREDPTGDFARGIARLEPEAVIDLICYTPEAARRLVDSLRGCVRRFLHCGTIWVHGYNVTVPVTEDQPRKPIDDYGVRKAAIETYLLEEAGRNNFPAAVIHPGHIVGQGWPPLNPQGHLSPWVFERLARGEELALPHLGLETFHHVHAADLAQGFVRALENWGSAAGRSFHIVSEAALTLRGYAEGVASWFGREARLTFVAWEDWRRTISEDEAARALRHITHSSNCSIARARKLLGYEPQYTSLEAVRDSVNWLIERGKIKTT
jgi:nucleoside-diphosphate-sugar epimerase